MFDLFFIAFSHLIAPKIRREMWQPTPVQLQLLGDGGEKYDIFSRLPPRFVPLLASFLGRCVSSPPRDAAREEKNVLPMKNRTNTRRGGEKVFLHFIPPSLPLALSVLRSSINLFCHFFHDKFSSKSFLRASSSTLKHPWLGMSVSFCPTTCSPHLTQIYTLNFSFISFPNPEKKYKILCFLSTSLLSCSLHFFVSSMTLCDTHCEESAYRRRVLILQMTLQAIPLQAAAGSSS